MLDYPLDNASECSISDIPVADQEHAMRLGIAFNGTQFVYRDFTYDRLADALNYSRHNRVMSPLIHDGLIGPGAGASI